MFLLHMHLVREVVRRVVEDRPAAASKRTHLVKKLELLVLFHLPVLEPLKCTVREEGHPASVAAQDARPGAVEAQIPERIVRSNNRTRKQHSHTLVVQAEVSAFVLE